VRVCVCVCVRTHTHTQYTHTHTHTCTQTRMSVCIYTYIYIYSVCVCERERERYEGAWDNEANGDRCVRNGRGVPGVSRGGAHAQLAGAWRAGRMRQDMTDAQVCGGATDGEASAVGSVAACAGPGLTG